MALGYNLIGNEIFNGDFDWVNDDFRAIFYDSSSYGPVQTDEFFSDLSGTVGENGGTDRASGFLLTGKVVVANGWIDADDLAFKNVSSALSLEGLVLYKDTGVDSTSRLIVAHTAVTGFPFTPNGFHVVVTVTPAGYRNFRAQ